jgi:hypothetical protein
MRTMCALTFAGALFATVSSHPSAAASTREADPLGTYVDCQDACRDCQKACEKVPAGSKNTDCMKACTASAAGCCNANGKNPPAGLTCTCQ